MEISGATRLAHVRYDIRGPVLHEAMRLEAEGHKILKLNIGNPAPFGFAVPAPLLADVTANLSRAHGYCDSKGLRSARQAVARHYQQRLATDTDIDVEDIFIGNGASELIVMALQALLNTGDEVLVPMPDYPLWTAAVSLCGARPVHYRCDEGNDWQPDPQDIAAKISTQTRAIVLINPNNPTGAVYTRELLTQVVELARRNNLLLLSDEIYDRIIYDDGVHVHTASLAPDLLCLTFNGLSKAYRVAGFRTGWMVITGPKGHAAGYLAGLETLASMRLGPNVPTQYAIEAALGGDNSIDDLIRPGGRLYEQRAVAWRLLNEIPGVSCVKPAGALYAFPRLDRSVHPIGDDQQFVLDLLRAQHLLVVAGSGFNWPEPDHFRVVTLPAAGDLEEAIGRIAKFLAGYHQVSGATAAAGPVRRRRDGAGSARSAGRSRRRTAG